MRPAARIWLGPGVNRFQPSVARAQGCRGCEVESRYEGDPRSFLFPHPSTRSNVFCLRFNPHTRSRCALRSHHSFDSCHTCKTCAVDLRRRHAITTPRARHTAVRATRSNEATELSSRANHSTLDGISVYQWMRIVESQLLCAGMEAAVCACSTVAPCVRG